MIRPRFNPDPLAQRRRQMISETEAFLNWAMQSGQDVPRIPRRRTDQGGFDGLIAGDVAKAAVRCFWRRALRSVGRY
ncbi:MAG: hypothetical protein AAF288_03790 [Planctomycetota bacterium]